MTLAVTGVESNEASLICTDDWVTNDSNGVVDVAFDSPRKNDLMLICNCE